jgi:hypothetical protein
MTQSKSGRSLLWVAALLVGIALVVVVAMTVMAMGRGEAAPSDLDYSTTRLSENGMFSVSYKPSAAAVPVNQMHEWTLHVETADGQPVENATIIVDGDMPEHGHGLPTKPQVTEYLGNGDYRVEGVKFQMAGWWVMDFTITADGQTDAVRFNMQLQ